MQDSNPLMVHPCVFVPVEKGTDCPEDLHLCELWRAISLPESRRFYCQALCRDGTDCLFGKRDAIHHHHLEATPETADVLELRRELLYTTPSGGGVYRIGLPN